MSKSIILIRHGKAEPRQKCRRDGERSLTEEGALELGQVARGLARLAQPTLILSSPLVRARQTAELIAQGLDPPPKIATMDELAEMDDPVGLLARLQLLADEIIALVGHEPGMGELAAAMVAGRRGARIEFKKAGVCRIDFHGKLSAGHGTLAWLIPPKVIACVGR